MLISILPNLQQNTVRGFRCFASTQLVPRPDLQALNRAVMSEGKCRFGEIRVGAKTMSGSEASAAPKITFQAQNIDTSKISSDLNPQEVRLNVVGTQEGRWHPRCLKDFFRFALLQNQQRTANIRFSLSVSVFPSSEATCKTGVGFQAC